MSEIPKPSFTTLAIAYVDISSTSEPFIIYRRIPGGSPPVCSRTHLRTLRDMLAGLQARVNLELTMRMDHDRYRTEWGAGEMEEDDQREKEDYGEEMCEDDDGT